MSIRNWISAVAFGLIVPCWSLAQDVEQQVSPAKTQTYSNGQPDVDGYDVPPQRVFDVSQTVSDPPAEKSYQGRSKNESGDTPWSWKWLLLGDNQAQAIMAWASVIAAFAAVYAASLLWVTLKETRRSDERQTRAYLCVAVSVHFNRTAGRFEFTLIATNRGQTPAFDAQITFEWTDEKFEEKFHIDMADGTSRGMVGPGSEMHAHGHTRESDDPMRFLTPERCEEIFNGYAPLTIYGRIHYLDAFGIGRHTNFRHRFYNRAGKYGLAMCEDGNDAN